MRHSLHRVVGLGAVCLALVSAAANCGEMDQPILSDQEEACKDAGDAAKDFNDFLRNYPTNLPVARVALDNTLSSLDAALLAARGDVETAIRKADDAVRAGLQALQNNQPFSINSMSTAIDAIGNACSIALGG